MVLVRRFCEAPRLARVASIAAIAASIAVIALSMLEPAVAAVSTGQSDSTLTYGQADGVELGAQYQVDVVGSTGVGTDLQSHSTSRTVQQVFAVQVGRSRDTGHFVRHLSEFCVGRCLVSSAVGAVTCFNSQFTHTLQNVGRRLQSAFSGLSNGDTVVGVLDSLVATTDLRLSYE